MIAYTILTDPHMMFCAVSSSAETTVHESVGQILNMLVCLLTHCKARKDENHAA